MKITKKQFENELQALKGKKQYLLSIFNNNIDEILNTLENVNDRDREKHISSYSRIIENLEIKNDRFSINSSNYYFKGKTNIYKIEHNSYLYYILHNVSSNNIIIYENII